MNDAGHEELLELFAAGRPNVDLVARCARVIVDTRNACALYPQADVVKA